VAVGATAGKPYEPVGWELWYPLRKRYEAGENVEVAAELREIVAEAPEYGLLFYNLACLESLNGDRAEALDHLRKSFELSEAFRDYAKEDSDLDSLREDPAFQELMQPADATAQA